MSMYLTDVYESTIHHASVWTDDILLSLLTFVVEVPSI